MLTFILSAEFLSGALAGGQKVADVIINYFFLVKKANFGQKYRLKLLWMSICPMYLLSHSDQTTQGVTT